MPRTATQCGNAMQRAGSMLRLRELRHHQRLLRDDDHRRRPRRARDSRAGRRRWSTRGPGGPLRGPRPHPAPEGRSGSPQAAPAAGGPGPQLAARVRGIVPRASANGAPHDAGTFAPGGTLPGLYSRIVNEPCAQGEEHPVPDRAIRTEGLTKRYACDAPRPSLDLESQREVVATSVPTAREDDHHPPAAGAQPTDRWDVPEIFGLVLPAATRRRHPAGWPSWPARRTCGVADPGRRPGPARRVSGRSTNRTGIELLARFEPRPRRRSRAYSKGTARKDRPLPLRHGSARPARARVPT